MPDVRAWSKSARLFAGVFSLAAALGGCASMVPQTMVLRDAWPSGVDTKAEIAGVPFFPQTEFQCGPAALATTLVHSGVGVVPDELEKLVYIPARQGSLQADMLAAPRRHGRVSYQLAPRFDDLLREVAAGNPVIVLQNNGVGPIVNWHYAVVVGFDYPAGELYLRSGEKERLALPFTIFEYSWKQSGYWAMVTPPPGRVPASATENAYLAAIAAMQRVGEPAAALEPYAAFLLRWPDNIAAAVGLGNLYHALGRLDAAEAVLRAAAARHPDSLVLSNNLAQTLSDLGRHEEALAVLQGAPQSAENPFSEVARGTLALIRERMGRRP